MKRITFGVLVALFVGGGGVAQAELRTWTDVSGKFKYEAEFAGEEDSNVKLRLADGRVAVIPFEKLSEADREFLLAKLKAEGWKIVEGPPPLVVEASPNPRDLAGTAEHFSELLRRPGKNDQIRGLEGLGKIYLGNPEPTRQAEGLELLARIEDLGDHEAWDEASAAIARHYSQNMEWEKAEEAWFAYVADKHTSRFSAEAWCMLGYAREKLAGEDGEKLTKAVQAYLFCFAKYKNQVRYSSVAWHRTAEIEWRRGEKEKAKMLIAAMLDQLGSLAEVTDPKARTDDVKRAQIELAKAKSLREEWSDADK